MTAEATARHTGDDLGGIKSEADLDRVIRSIGLCDLQIDQIDHEMDLAVKKAQDEALIRRGPFAAQREGLFALAETYLMANEDALLKGNRSRKLNFGEIGFRKSTASLELPSKGSPEMDDLVTLIEAFSEIEPDIYGGITIHTDRYVLKADFKEVSPEALKELKIERKPGKDKPFVKPNRARCLEVSEAA
jgi:hypothetical protein